MPYKYVRKSTQQSWDVEARQHAIEAERRNKMTYAAAAKQFNDLIVAEGEADCENEQISTEEVAVAGLGGKVVAEVVAVAGPSGGALPEEVVVAEPSGGALAEEVAVAGLSFRAVNEEVAVAGRPGGEVQSLFAVSPKEINPFPKQTIVMQRKQNRKKGRAAVITSSPYKNERITTNMYKKKLRTRRERGWRKKAPHLIQNKPNSQKKAQAKKAALTLRRLSFEPEENDDDEECFYCKEVYSKSKDDEGWIRCETCKNWAHEECAGWDEDDEFVCEFCKLALFRINVSFA